MFADQPLWALTLAGIPITDPTNEPAARRLLHHWLTAPQKRVLLDGHHPRLVPADPRPWRRHLGVAATPHSRNWPFLFLVLVRSYGPSAPFIRDRFYPQIPSPSDAGPLLATLGPPTYAFTAPETPTSPTERPPRPSNLLIPAARAPLQLPLDLGPLR